jgi:type III pantothenate kinase
MRRRMLLCIDCGNTNTVFAVWDGARFLATLRCATNHQRTADEYFVWFSALMRHHGLPVEIDEVIVSSTVPRVVFNLRVLADRYFGTRPLVVGKPDCLLPAPPRVDPGTQVGPDRLVNTAGAHDRHGGDLIVVDFGTATTFDVVAHDGAYVGGVIAPGVNLSLEALHMAAAALPHVDVTKPQQVIGTNTVACMQSGVFWGYVGLVREISDRIRAEHDRPMRVIGTGGLAPLLAQGDVLFDGIEDDLTMHGLTVIHRYNKDNHA